MLQKESDLYFLGIIDTKNVQILYSSQQEKVTYFKSLYRVEVFGVCKEAMP
ncbi:8151_t:CDS:2 [Cetraspora pellucida]|uniref:8151_t:CDS:1 n=1 Tax=Cetraspora pellucida TaxID=1433469 RepID=A0A9N9FVB9_9GLOM|nr:8151_t:CDS:2 [Cetraspora pellucida]